MPVRTRIVQTRLVPKGDIVAVTLFGLVFTRDKDMVDRYVLNHELIHCQQQLEWLYIPFFFLYLGEWLWHLVRLHSARQAYMAISFEREAYDNGHNLHYLETRRLYANYRHTSGQNGNDEGGECNAKRKK